MQICHLNKDAAAQVTENESWNRNHIATEDKILYMDQCTENLTVHIKIL